MNVLISGGSGLIGKQLTSTLIDDGNTVTILSRNPDDVNGFPREVKFLQWDGKTVQKWGDDINNCDAVINLTGENLSGKGIFPSRWTKNRKLKLLQSRVNAGNALSKAIDMANKKPDVFIQASGIGIYGTKRGEVYTEESEIANDYLANLSKMWEASSEYVEKVGVRRVIIRTGVVLSPTGGALRPLLLQYRLFVGGPIGDGRQIYSWIHIRDVVNAMRFVIRKHDAKGIYNLSSPNPVSNSEFGKVIGKVYRRPNYLRIPGYIMRMVFGEVANMVLEGQYVVPRKLLEQGYQFKFSTLEIALRDLAGYQ